MTAETIAPDSLDWVTFTEEDESCDIGRIDPCLLEAVARAYWQACSCIPNPMRLCVAHRDAVAGAASEYAWFRCVLCTCRVLLLRIEPIR